MPRVQHQCGVYVILNHATGGFYVGSSNRLAIRSQQHWNDLRAGRHANARLQRAWSIHGPYQLDFIILALVSPAHRLLVEDALLALYFDDPKCYNATPTASVFTHTPETRAKIAEAQRGKPMSAAARAGLLAANVGRVPSEAERAACGDRFRGRPKPAEQREKIAAARRAYWTPERRAEQAARTIGRTLSAESRRKISQAKTGRKPSPEAIEAMRRCQRDYRHPPELVARIAEQLRGRKRPPEAVENMRRARWGERPPDLFDDMKTGA